MNYRASRAGDLGVGRYMFNFRKAFEHGFPTNDDCADESC
jgi:hypothetical protein